MSFLRALLISLLGIFLLAPVAHPLFAQDPKAILEQVRFQQTHQEITLQGHLRVGRDSHPFQLTWKGDTMRYDFRLPARAYLFRFGSPQTRITHITRDGTEQIDPTRRHETLYNSGITFEDLAMEFLYWDDATFEGSDFLRTRNVWKIRVKPGNRSTHYGSVLLWVDQRTHALMRVDAFDKQNRLVKKLEVLEIQQLPDTWALKRMRMEVYDPERGRVTQRSYLEIDD